jgi:hypothetical protein
MSSARFNDQANLRGLYVILISINFASSKLRLMVGLFLDVVQPLGTKAGARLPVVAVGNAINYRPSLLTQGLVDIWRWI